MFKIKALVFIGFLALLGPQRALSQWADICGDQTDGTRLPLPLDCRRFVLCLDRAVSAVGSCPRGLHFNSQLGECDYQWRAKCRELSPFFVDDSDEECVCTCCEEECKPSEDESTTPCDPELGTTNTDEIDDSVETDVTGTDPTEGTTQNTNTDQPQSTTKGTSPTESTTKVTPTTSTTNSPPGNLVPTYCSNKRPDCASQPDGTMLPLPGVCNKYIQCTHGCCNEMPCPGGLYYDPKMKRCNTALNVECTPTGDTNGEVAGPSGTSCNDQGVCKGQPDGNMFADPDSNGYYICQCQCPIARPCDANTKFNQTAQVCDWDKTSGSGTNVLCPNGLVYNATSDECDYPENYVPEITCDNNSDVCQGQDNGALFPVEGVCNMFYKCNFNCAVEQTCPNNLIYDIEEKLCNFPQNVDCPWEYTPPSGPNAGPSGIACESNGRCKGQREGTFLPSLTNCSSYVVCQCECEIDMNCKEGLYWDTKKSTCNYANQVDCTL